MKKLYGIFLLLIISCSSSKKLMQPRIKLNGEYVLKTDKMFQAFTNMNYHSLVLNEDGSYILNKAKITFTPVIEQCQIASKGKWTTLSNDVLELTSDDKYSKQKGFEYELIKEAKFSQDSLYIKINFPDEFDQSLIKSNFIFNSNNSKAIETEKTLIILPKAKYLRTVSKENQISFYIKGNLSYKSRAIFEIFEEYIDTEKSNYLTINLPNFDRCFFEFEPLNKDLIYIKSKNQLFWQGDTWEKKE